MNLHDSKLFQQQAFINGQWCAADSGATLEVMNPATQQPLGTVPNMGAGETQRAIEAANQALPAWRGHTAKQRSEIMQRWYALVVTHQDDLARLMTLEQGKPLAEARGEILYAASFIQWFAEEAKRAYGDVIPSPVASSRLLVIKQPIGVCAAITPWNFPAAMITRKAAAALAAGCTMVIKPASQTPFSALALMELAQRAGVPDGVLSVVTGSAREIGAELTSNSLVRKLSFTGSTEVGRTLLRQCAEDIKKVSLELGGNAPFIVFEDADLDAAVTGALAAKYRNAGQTCVCVNRFYVHEAVYEDFAQRFTQAVQALRMGDGLQEGVQIGPLIDQAAVDKVQSHIQDALSQGAQLVYGGQAEQGTFFQPTVLTEVPNTALLTRDEVFGPVAGLIRFSTEAEVIELANNTEYGLAAYFYSRDVGRCLRVGEALEYGMIGINSGMISNEVAPFGGIKASGLGREGSKYGLDDYMEIKYLHLGGI
ncbi:NADP-dependent succinate-semialdehyde dehydrogenase [Thiopseudomonas acetoxidans]|uniref:NADP-dependent succinate-semialdehyde dehydrogenase n=1 Tax=Thiopseudomonas acetoxidans TaxID=3041622 RepID=A0ABT7SN82_9GAMM|nr:NADP-dependent succinate-semialdehyde dehydrogenase [Thiopseudomonas sp. CY1220]MDM7857631.1 NADP-dependent succinate-semialdehyde dehydrogenase [Thiopseudomonas sp. CY1220]